MKGSIKIICCCICVFFFLESQSQYLSRNVRQFVVFDSIDFTFDFDIASMDDIILEVGDDYELDSVFKHKKDNHRLYSDVYINSEKTLRWLRMNYVEKGIEFYFSPKNQHISYIILREGFQGAIRRKIKIGESKIKDVLEAFEDNANWGKLYLADLDPIYYLDYNQIGFEVKKLENQSSAQKITGVLIKNRRRYVNRFRSDLINDYEDFDMLITLEMVDKLDLPLTIDEYTRNKLKEIHGVDWDNPGIIHLKAVIDSAKAFKYSMDTIILKLIHEQYVKIDDRGEETVMMNLRDSLRKARVVTKELVKQVYMQEFPNYFQRNIRLLQLRYRAGKFRYEIVYITKEGRRQRIFVDPNTGIIEKQAKIGDR